MADPARPAAAEGESVEAHDPTHSTPPFGPVVPPKPLPWERYPVPDRITLEDGERVRKEMRGMVQGDIDTYYPEDLITYATGHRKGVDAEGTGPGMYYALWLALLLQACGIKCFSGLCVAGGVNWKVFLDKLGGRFARCKRLFVVQTDALYNSRPCLQEIYTAVSRKLRVLPVLFEKTPLMFRPKDQWPQLTVNDSEGKGWLLDVQRIFGALNSLPSPPATVMEQSAALLETLGQIAAEGNTAARTRGDVGTVHRHKHRRKGKRSREADAEANEDRVSVGRGRSRARSCTPSCGRRGRVGRAGSAC